VNVGFTGTRRGMTPAQSFSLASWLTDLRALTDEVDEFHFGDCVGWADGREEWRVPVIAPHTDENVELWIARFETTLAEVVSDQDVDPDEAAHDVAMYSMIEPPDGYDGWDHRTERAGRNRVL
jgi:hypothetical protein